MTEQQMRSSMTEQRQSGKEKSTMLMNQHRLGRITKHTTAGICWLCGKPYDAWERVKVVWRGEQVVGYMHSAHRIRLERR